MSQTQLGPFDITLLFQKGAEIVPGQMAAVDQVAVVLAPQHFKALLRSMNETMQAYETLYGNLTIPDSETAPLKNAEEIVALMKEIKAKATAANPSSSEPTPLSRQSRAAARKKEPTL
jgi:Protein of unknown function (DUF3467)